VLPSGVTAPSGGCAGARVAPTPFDDIDDVRICVHSRSIEVVDSLISSAVPQGGHSTPRAFSSISLYCASRSSRVR